MGNLCGKEETNNFAQPGRTVSSAPAPKSTSSVPRKVGGPARKLGSSNAAASATAQTSESADDARRKAAEAAEVCLNENPVLSVETLADLSYAE